LNKFILGSGIIGLLSRHILGSDYRLIPFNKSRYYSYEVPIADDTITYSDQTSDVISGLNLVETHRYFPTAISISGQLVFNKEVWSQTVVDKLYRNDPHPLAAALLSKDINVHDTSAKRLFETLLAAYSDEIMANKDAVVSSIGDHTIVIDGQKYEVDQIVSTIPLNALLEFIGIGYNFKSHDYHVSLVASDAFDLEGAQRVFIADPSIPFWKVNVLGREMYQFFSNGYVENSEAIFALMAKNRFRVMAETTVKEAFPLGEPPRELLSKLENMGIKCVGSNARWDYFFDISTSINSLLKTHV